MGIYIFEILLILVCPFLVRRIKNSKAIYCSIVTLMLICVMGFRTENMGLYDVRNVYFPMFDRVNCMSFPELFQQYPLIRGNLFQVATKLFTYISKSKYAWLFFTSAPYLVAMSHTIKKYSVNKYTCSFCFFMIMGMRIYASNFFLIRHSIAMAILVYAFDGIVEKNLKKFIMLVILAAMFHSTAIVFIVAYPLARLKPSWKQLLITVVCFYAIIYMSSGIMQTIFGFIDAENYYSAFKNRNSGFDSFTFPILCAIQFIIAFLLVRKNGVKSELDSITVNTLCIGTVIMGASTMLGEFYRLSYFFMTVSIVGLANIIRSEKNLGIRYSLFTFLFVVFFWFMVNGLEPQGLISYESWLF